MYKDGFLYWLTNTLLVSYVFLAVASKFPSQAKSCFLLTALEKPFRAQASWRIYRISYIVSPVLQATPENWTSADNYSPNQYWNICLHVCLVSKRLANWKGRDRMEGEVCEKRPILVNPWHCQASFPKHFSFLLWDISIFKKHASSL